jgi:hypothetical protein
MDWILSGFTIVSNIILGRKNKLGWMIMFIAGWLWLYYALFYLHPAQLGLIPATLINLYISAKNWWDWRRDEKHIKEKFYDTIEKVESIGDLHPKDLTPPHSYRTDDRM